MILDALSRKEHKIEGFHLLATVKTKPTPDGEMEVFT